VNISLKLTGISEKEDTKRSNSGNIVTKILPKNAPKMCSLPPMRTITRKAKEKWIVNDVGLMNLA
jgi:hypothetical protein